MRNIRNIYLLFAVVIVVMLLGFYFLFNKISGIENIIGNNGTQNVLPGSTSSPLSVVTTTGNSGSEPTTTGSSANGTQTGSTTTGSQATSAAISIASNILFNASSSADLEPQTDLTILVSKVSEMTDGTLAVAVKVFTDSASSYSAVDMGNLIQIFNPTGSNTVADNVVGAFKAMPPQSSVDGAVNFKIDPGTTSIILEVGSPDSPNFYQFDFNAKTYKQTTVG